MLGQLLYKQILKWINFKGKPKKIKHLKKKAVPSLYLCDEFSEEVENLPNYESFNSDSVRKKSLRNGNQKTDYSDFLEEGDDLSNDFMDVSNTDLFEANTGIKV